MEFKEYSEDDAIAPFSLPSAIVELHVHIPGPLPGPHLGLFSNHVANGVLEVIESVCTFALGRPMDLPPGFFYTREKDQQSLNQRRYSTNVRGLARKGVSLNIFDELVAIGGSESHLKLRAALMTSSLRDVHLPS